MRLAVLSGALAALCAFATALGGDALLDGFAAPPARAASLSRPIARIWQKRLSVRSSAEKLRQTARNSSAGSVVVFIPVLQRGASRSSNGDCFPVPLPRGGSACGSRF